MFIKCDICFKGIKENEPHHTINLHLERMNNFLVSVDDAETILTTCKSCGRNINKEAVARVFSTKNADKARLLGELFIPMEAN